ncbi:hypothetical protein [Rhodopseudomonas palustris]|uniref:hypothetical protein n=1 Tax=Rhodopseudomonas palustris TaxID=1076 RepID=UPI0002DBBCE9|nr:hypothetical protein [Rhodopseudomonas palustris]
MPVVILLLQQLCRAARRVLLLIQPDDVPETFVGVGDLNRDVGFKQETAIDDGIRAFVAWYRAHQNV